MKMDQAKYEEIKEGIEAVVEYYGRQRIMDALTQRTLGSLMWSLFSKVWFDKQFDDNHPTYISGQPRVLPYVSFSWLNDLYKSGLHDSHIQTALHRIAKDLGLI